MDFNYLFGITMMVLKLGTLRMVPTSSKILSVAVAVAATIGTRLTIERRRRTSVYFFLNVLPLKCINVLSISKIHSQACQYTTIVISIKSQSQLNLVGEDVGHWVNMSIHGDLIMF
jgi:hypothetical protein